MIRSCIICGTRSSTLLMLPLYPLRIPFCGIRQHGRDVLNEHKIQRQFSVEAVEYE